MMNIASKIYIVGNRGMVAGTLYRNLLQKGYVEEKSVVVAWTGKRNGNL
jgi:hypothetical protein